MRRGEGKDKAAIRRGDKFWRGRRKPRVSDLFIVEERLVRRLAGLRIAIALEVALVGDLIDATGKLGADVLMIGGFLRVDRRKALYEAVRLQPADDEFRPGHIPGDRAQLERETRMLRLERHEPGLQLAERQRQPRQIAGGAARQPPGLPPENFPPLGEEVSRHVARGSGNGMLGVTSGRPLHLLEQGGDARGEALVGEGDGGG